jgi:hypothetical protein
MSYIAASNDGGDKYHPLIQKTSSENLLECQNGRYFLHSHILSKNTNATLGSNGTPPHPKCQLCFQNWEFRFREKLKFPVTQQKPGQPLRPSIRSKPSQCIADLPDKKRSARHVQFEAFPVKICYFYCHEVPLSVNNQRPKTLQRKATPLGAIQLINLPRENLDDESSPVLLKTVMLSTDRTQIVGTVVVRNLAFEKTVAARFTSDLWVTVSEVMAKYNHSADHLYDEFEFTIDVSSPKIKVLLFCMRYAVNGQEFWDNNGTLNYHIDLNHQLNDGKEQQQQQTIGPPCVPTGSYSHPLSWSALGGLPAEEKAGSLVLKADRPLATSRTLPIRLSVIDTA